MERKIEIEYFWEIHPELVAYERYRNFHYAKPFIREITIDFIKDGSAPVPGDIFQIWGEDGNSVLMYVVKYRQYQEDCVFYVVDDCSEPKREINE